MLVCLISAWLIIQCPVQAVPCQGQCLAPRSAFERKPKGVDIVQRIAGICGRDASIAERFSEYYKRLTQPQREKLDDVFERVYILLCEYGYYVDSVSGVDDSKEAEEYFSDFLKTYMYVIENLPESDEWDFGQVCDVLEGSRAELYQKLVVELSENRAPQAQNLDQLDNSLLVRGIALEDRCPNNCLHCNAGHPHKGKLGYFDLANLIKNKRIRFPVTSRARLSITYSEPLTYRDGDKDIVDVVELIVRTGAPVIIVTSGFGVSEARLDDILNRLNILSKKHEGKIDIVLSVNLFMPVGRTQYTSRIVHT